MKKKGKINMPATGEHNNMLKNKNKIINWCSPDVFSIFIS
jgi:hypothetical protein